MRRKPLKAFLGANSQDNFDKRSNPKCFTKKKQIQIGFKFLIKQIFRLNHFQMEIWVLFSIGITAADDEIVSDALKIEKGPREVIQRFQNQTFLD